MPSIGQQHERRIAAVRGFNRFYTRQIGVLRKNFLDSPYTLGEARVLYEIGRRRLPTASDVGRALDLDAGYLSRVLRNFEKSGLIARTASAQDARRSYLALTMRGKKVMASLNSRSQRDVSDMLGKLEAADQGRLMAAMSTIETLLGGAPEEEQSRSGYILREPRPGDFGWVVKRHAELYAQEYQWKEPFEGVCAQIVADFVNKYDPKLERCWIAEMNGENVGCIMRRQRVCRQLHAFDCCWSIRRRAGSGLAHGSPTNASDSRAVPATRRSRYGRTACSPRRAISTRRPASS